MSFLEPLLLLAMPLIGLPILIHLLNQRRHKTAPWAARHFVVQASNRGRGIANFRHWIVLALRTLAIAAIIFAISRPLVSRIPGLGFLGTQRTQIVILDRSPSMAIENVTNGLTWRETVLNQLQSHLQSVGGQRLLFHSLSDTPVPMPGADFVGMPETQITDTQTNIPQLLERALRRVESQSMGPTDIWVCTDRQSADWQLDSGRWSRIREKLETLSEVKLQFLTPESSDQFNLAISASNIKLVREGKRNFVYLDFAIEQTSGDVGQRIVPVQVMTLRNERNVEVEMVAANFQYQQLKIEVDDAASGGGVIRLPHDSNQIDNRYYFSYSTEPVRNTVVVSDEQEVIDLLELACSTPLKSNQRLGCKVLPSNAQSEIEWENTALVIWHAAVPADAAARHLENFVARGGNVLFLPTDSAGSQNEIFGVRWGQWESNAVPDLQNPASQTLTPVSISAGSQSSDDFRVAQWRTEDDILATDESGRQLPMDGIMCNRRCGIESENGTVLASFEDASPMLVRAVTDNGAAYFMATTPAEPVSNFAQNGVSLFVMLHRALEQGAAALSGHQQLQAGDHWLTQDETRPQKWQPLQLSDASVFEDQRAFHGGVYQAGQQVIAINRPVSEDQSVFVEEAMIAEVLGQDSFELITSSADSLAGLSNEIWKLFVIAMVVALIAEGWYSLPSVRKPSVLESGAAA